MDKAEIYKIYCCDDAVTDIYIGSSVSTYSRFKGHIKSYNNQIRNSLYKKIEETGGFNNWKYEIIEYVDKNMQRIKEQEWIDKLKPTLNERRAYTDKETAKKLRKEHEAPLKEEIARKKKEWRQNEEVKEREREQAKVWRETHKEQHAELTRKWREENKEYVAEYAIKRYHENREQINARRRELYALRKQNI